MIPTSGTPRRRTKAIRNRRRVHARENDRLVAAGGLPRHFGRLRGACLNDDGSDR